MLVKNTVSAYFSKEHGSWVCLEKQEDGEYSHLSGFSNKYAALAKNYNLRLYGEVPLPEFLREEKPQPKGLWDQYGMPSFLSE